MEAWEAWNAGDLGRVVQVLEDDGSLGLANAICALSNDVVQTTPCPLSHSVSSAEQHSDDSALSTERDTWYEGSEYSDVCRQAAEDEYLHTLGEAVRGDSSAVLRLANRDIDSLLVCAARLVLAVLYMREGEEFHSVMPLLRGDSDLGTGGAALLSGIYGHSSYAALGRAAASVEPVSHVARWVRAVGLRAHSSFALPLVADVLSKEGTELCVLCDKPCLEDVVPLLLALNLR